MIDKKSVLLEVISSGNPSEGVRRLHSEGKLIEILPEMEESWDFDQNSKFHSMSLTDHELAVLDKVVEQGAGLELRLAALLHDCSKYREHQVKADGHFGYVGHEKSSAVLAGEILRRLGFSEPVVIKVEKLIRHHMIIKPCGSPYIAKDSKTRKVLRVLGENLEDEMKLIEADNLSHHPDHCLHGQTREFLGIARRLKIAQGPVLSESEILEAFPGSNSKELLEVTRRYQDENPDVTKEQSLQLIKLGYKVKKGVILS